MNVPIQPKNITIACTYTALRIQSVIVTPFTSAMINVATTIIQNDVPPILPSTISPVYTTLTMSGADYQNWNQDDQFLINWVLGQLGFTAPGIKSLNAEDTTEITLGSIIKVNRSVDKPETLIL